MHRVLSSVSADHEARMLKFRRILSSLRQTFHNRPYRGIFVAAEPKRMILMRVNANSY